MPLRAILPVCLFAFAIEQVIAAPGNLLVLSKGEHMLSIVDVDSGKVLARMPSGSDPHEVVSTPDGAFAYISNYGGGSLHTLTPVDLIHHKTLPVVELGALHGPHGLAVGGGKIWFTAEGSKVIGSYDPTHMVYVAEDLKKIYTTNVSSATVTLLEEHAAKFPAGPPPGGAGPAGPPPGPPPGPPGGAQRMEWEETVVPVGAGAEGFDVSPDGKELWTANAMDGTISILDLASRKVAETLAADVGGANRLKFTLDGKLALVSSLRGSDLTVLDAASRKVIKRVAIGHGAAGIQMEPGGARAFVACTPDSYVAVIDLRSLEVSGHISAGKEPDGLAWRPAK